MAKKRPTVYLGYIDEQICETDSCDFTNNKIGGKPVWKSDISGSKPVCKICGIKSVLVYQLYAPLENSPYHRCLFVFACINPKCWNKKESWVCVRYQCIDPTYTVTNASVHNTVLNVENPVCQWSENAEDWGSESVVDDDNGNIENGMINLTLSSSNNCNHNQDNDAGSAGATGFDTHTIATAEIENGEGDVVEIESPISTDVNVMSLLYSSIPLPQVSSENFQFVPYYLNFELEAFESSSPDQHVSSLLQAYTKSNHLEVDNAPCPVGEGYEKSAPGHGDKCFHRFISRIRHNPGHVMRYCRDNSEALWMSRAKVTQGLHCPHCASHLTFECQLISSIIPSLLLQLSPSGSGEQGHLEFGCVYVFTCAASCWAEDTRYREETVIVQTEDY